MREIEDSQWKTLGIPLGLANAIKKVIGTDAVE